MGTGGAILNSLKQFPQEKPIFVINGDTFLKINYQAMFHQHQGQDAALTVALQSMKECGRYGTVEVKDLKIISFKEKNNALSGLINAGIYLLNPDLFNCYPQIHAFSFEEDFLMPNINTLNAQAFLVNDYFIDIGIPEDYQRAMQELPLVF